MFKKNIFKNHDWIITALVAILLTIGTITIYSTTYNAQTIADGQGLFKKQIVLIILGFIIYFGLGLFDYKWLKEPKILIGLFIMTILMLLYVKFFTSEIANTNRWISIGPITIQPAEYAKITIIIITSATLAFKKLKTGKYNPTKDTGPWKTKSTNSFFKKEGIEETLNQSKKSKLFDNFLTLIFISALFVAPILLLILVQPSLGNTLIAGCIWLGIVMVAYPNKKELISLLIIFTLTLILSYQIFISGFSVKSITFILITIGAITGIIYFLKPKLIETILITLLAFLIIPIGLFTWNNIIKDYQKTRVEAFLNPENDPQGAGWQVRQSKIAIGSGRVFGRGFLEGTQSGLKILPFPHTDFIFASYAEQFGFIGSTILTILLLALPLRVFWVASDTKDSFARLMAYGVGIMLILHIFINIGMNLGKLPVTGIPLPLISYGGSAVLMIMISLGLVQNTLKYNLDEGNVVKLRF